MSTSKTPYIAVALLLSFGATQCALITQVDRDKLPVEEAAGGEGFGGESSGGEGGALGEAGASGAAGAGGCDAVGGGAGLANACN